MKKSEFEHGITAAESLREICTDPESSSYWSGYARGIRRHYHGEKFCTTQEHVQWLRLTADKHDRQRRFLGIGYQVGLSGTPVADAMRRLGRSLAASTAGAAGAGSEARARAARENAAKPKPRKSKT